MSRSALLPQTGQDFFLPSALWHHIHAKFLDTGFQANHQRRRIWEIFPRQLRPVSALGMHYGCFSFRHGNQGKNGRHDNGCKHRHASVFSVLLIFHGRLFIRRRGLIGKNAGALDFNSLRHVGRRLLHWSAFMAMAFLIVYTFGSSLITDMITDVENVREGVWSMRFFIWLFASGGCMGFHL